MDNKKRSLIDWLPFWVLMVSMMVGFYYITFHEYEYKSTVGGKLYVGSKYKLDQYKGFDLDLSEAEYLALRMTYPNKVYVSNEEFFLIVEGDRNFVSKEKYNKYNVGDTITYCRGLISSIKIIK
jgi:hypothetical protein